MTERIVTLAERPDLAEAVPAVLGSRWPAFMLAGHPGHGVDLTKLAGAAAGYQVLLVDPADQVLGVGLSVPLDWDGTPEGLPPGWDGAVSAGADLLAHGGAANAACALSITLTPAASGRGRSAPMIGALRAAAANAGARALVAPVRPVLKAQYPLTAMARYVAWRTPDGAVFDPWLRVHLQLGGTLLGIVDPSMTITGTVAEWQDWTGLALPDSGPYVIPGGLVPLLVDTAADRAVYREPNVWVAHPART